MSGVVIIGAGHGGSQLAVSLRSEGFQGSITLIDPHAGIPYHKPPLSKTYLKNEAERAQFLRSESAYADAGIRRLEGRVTAIDTMTRTVLVDGAAHGYDDLVFATGAENRQIPDLAGLENVFSLRTLDDAFDLRASLPSVSTIAIIGGGFIGLETASVLASLGKTVTVLEAAPRVLARVAAPHTSALITQSLQALGVEIRTNWKGSGYRVDGQRLTSIIGDGMELPVDLALVAIGAIANIDLARQAGIVCNTGIVTDQWLATSASNVWAIGDVAEIPHWQSARGERIESVQNATDQARALARTLATAEPEAYRAVPWFWSDIGPKKLQIAGLSHGADAVVVRETTDALAIFHLRNGSLIAVETVNSNVDHMIARKLIERGITPTEDQMMSGPAALKALLA